jgi:diguanylate cyclase (GGDEF)-like protein
MTDHRRDSLSEHFAASVASIRDARVVVLEGDDPDRAILARSVRAWWAIAFEARTTADAERLYRTMQPDIALLDDATSGVEVLKLTRTFKREAPLVPVILLTGSDDLESKRRALAAGADEVLTTPVNLAELQIRVCSLLRVKRLADELAVANKQLSTLATVDPLTQLANRRSLMDRLGQEFARWRRYGKPMGCLLLDVDHFKQINDTWGHAMGDRVLVAISGAVAGAVRDTDLAGRYGGEELMVVAPETGPADAVVFGERLRNLVASLVDTNPGLPSVTVSIGVATTELPVQSVDELIVRADAALYEAKRGGRNRTIAAT